jgi:hypothetical protein
MKRVFVIALILIAPILLIAQTPVNVRAVGDVTIGPTVPVNILAIGVLASGNITSSMNATVSTALISGTPSSYTYLTSCTFSNDHASVDTLMFLQDGSGGNTLWGGFVLHKGVPTVATFPTPLKVPTLGNGVYVKNNTSGSSTYASCNGFVSTVSY